MLILYGLLVLVSFARTSFAQGGSCREGLYGDNCELTCSKTCRTFQTFPCDKNTGQCSEGCQRGYYGDQCDKQCSCASGVCYQQNGKCLEISATTDRTTQNTTTIRIGSPEINATTEEPVCVCDGEQDVWLVVGIIFIVLTVILFLILIGMVLFKTVRRRMKQTPRTASGTRNRRFLKFPCCTGIGGEDNETTGQNLPLTGVNTTPEPESGVSHVEQAAEATEDGESAQGQAPSDDQQSDRHVAKLEEEKEKLSQTIKELKDEKTKMEEKHISEKRQLEDKFKAEHNQALLDLGLPADSTIHWTKIDKLDPSLLLQCPHLKFDKETINVKFAHVDDNMNLINSPDPSPGRNNSRRFKTFRGTTCTSPLDRTGYYQYFEAVFYMLLKKKFGGGEVVMQIGFCEGKDKDANKLTEGKKSCFVVKAVGCTKHNGICLVFTQGGKSECILKLNDNTVDSSTKVNIGIRLNKEYKRLGVYDFGKHKELWKSNININDRIWPMFGVCEQDRATVRVELKSGRNIEMSRGKKDIIKPKDKMI